MTVLIVASTQFSSEAVRTKTNKSPAVVEIADRTEFGNFRGGEFEGSGSVYGVESCTVVFLGGRFLFTCSDTFAVRCII